MHSRLNIPAPAGVKIGRDAQRKVIRQSNAELRALPEAYHRTRRREKLMGILRYQYRKATQVGECKCTQARERNLSKELGTLAP